MNGVQTTTIFYLIHRSWTVDFGSYRLD